MAGINVSNQVPAGMIDAFTRADPADGTLGVPDYSPVPYSYMPMLGISDRPQWAITTWGDDQVSISAFKGSADGWGLLRSTGDDRGAYAVRLRCQSTQEPEPSPDGSRAPQYTWGEGDFALAVRHPGPAHPFTPSTPRAYLAFSNGTVQMRLTTVKAQGPWDTEPADAAPYQLGGTLPDPWDGDFHTYYVGVFAQNVLLVIDRRAAFVFRSPRAYQHDAAGKPVTSVWADLPANGWYGGYDTRSQAQDISEWYALQGPSGDCFLYDDTPTTVQKPPTGNYVSTQLPSGEAWSMENAICDATGITLDVGGRALFTPQAAASGGFIATRWGATQKEAGLLFRYTSPTNYIIVTSTGLWYKTDSNAVWQARAWTTPLKNGDAILIDNRIDSYSVWCNGVQIAAYLANPAPNSRIGLYNPSPLGSPANGPATFRYIAFQPVYTVLPAQFTPPAA